MSSLELVHQNHSKLHLQCPIFLLCVIRDEYLLLEHFVDYYKSLGVTHFIFIDNLSEDAGPKYLESLKDINLWLYRTEDSYRDAAYGTTWINELLGKHCRGHYCFTIDVDELFLFDTTKYQTLQQLIDDMELDDANVIPVTLLDMYPKKTNASYQRGQKFLSHSPYFDNLNKDFYRELGVVYKTFVHKVGGVRERVLGTTVCIHKFSFFKYDFYPLGVAPGYHFFQACGEPLRQSDKIRLHKHPSVLLHFKFIKPNFKVFVEQRISNNQDWKNSSEYRSYLDVLQTNEDLDFFDERYTKRLIKHEDIEFFFSC